MCVCMFVCACVCVCVYIDAKTLTNSCTELNNTATQVLMCVCVGVWACVCAWMRES